jgi:hypothetical protein
VPELQQSSRICVNVLELGCRFPWLRRHIILDLPDLQRSISQTLLVLAVLCVGSNQER